jgi:hypothetical protein
MVKVGGLACRAFRKEQSALPWLLLVESSEKRHCHINFLDRCGRYWRNFEDHDVMVRFDLSQIVGEDNDWLSATGDFRVLEHKSPKSDMSQSPRGPNFTFHSISCYFMAVHSISLGLGLFGAGRCRRSCRIRRSITWKTVGLLSPQWSLGHRSICRQAGLPDQTKRIWKKSWALTRTFN